MNKYMKRKYINVMWVTLINYDFYANLGFVYSPDNFWEL